MLAKKKKSCLARSDLGSMLLLWFWLFLEGRFQNAVMGLLLFPAAIGMWVSLGYILFPVLCNIYMELVVKFVQRPRDTLSYTDDTQI